MFTVIKNGDVYAPEPLGTASVLLCNERILKVGEVDSRVLDQLGIEFEVIDAAGQIVTPGFIDPHEHLLGGSGEQGFSTQTPEIALSEILAAGITTVVGCLGVDTTMKTMPGLLARVKAFHEEGLNAFMWTGGYNVPPTTILNSVREDVLFISEVIGAGEVAISDERSTDPSPRELARLIDDAHVGGMLSAKAGVTHFHVGPGRKRLTLLRTLIDEFDVQPTWLYPTHVGRSDALLKEAIGLAKQGATVDLDVVEKDLPKRLRTYLDKGGDPERLTVSTDAALMPPKNLHSQIRTCVLEHNFPLELVLPLVTKNTAQVLKLADMGHLGGGAVADVLVLDRDSLEIVEVISRGKRMVREGALVVQERFLEESGREIHLCGQKAEPGTGVLEGKTDGSPRVAFTRVRG